MTTIVDFDAARKRLQERVAQHPIAQALDALALALVDHGHNWTDEEVMLYETAISYCGCTDSGSSA